MSKTIKTPQTAKKAQSDADAVMVLRQQVENEIAHRLHREKLSGALVNDLRAKLEKAVKCLEQCHYFTVMRDPQINTHKQACDHVQDIARACLKELRGE